MSRPDWGALQQEYIAEYTRSGISPVAWCEARGLNYATARRYIKKTPKNAQTEMCKTAQKSAQKKSAQTAQKRNEKSQEKKPVFDAGLNEGDAEEFSFCPDEFGISDQQAKFAMLVAQGKKPTEAYRLAGYQLSLFDSMLPDFVADVHPLVGISPDALYAAAMARPFQGRLLSEWASDLEADRLRRITNTVRQGFLLGDTNEQQIARKIRGHVSKGFQDGALQMSRANAASIAKTAVGHLAATARESFASANNDLIKGKQWLSTLDNRTTPQCRIRDRLKYTLNNKPVGHSVPYLQGPGKIHFCCRSTETFILKSAKELGIDVRDISPAERASMDGVVAGDTTYREWFLRQPYTRQKQIVGETRAKLIRDGGMSPDEFYTDKGEWLTLKQLRERDAQVFRKAGI